MASGGVLGCFGRGLGCVPGGVELFAGGDCSAGGAGPCFDCAWCAFGVVGVEVEVSFVSVFDCHWCSFI